MLYRIAFSLLLLASFATRLAAADVDEEAAYRQAIHDRAQRITDTLDLSNVSEQRRVTMLIADQYRALRDEHASRDAQLQQRADDAEAVRAASRLHVMELHRKFLAQLRVDLSAEQVEQVKDGMTYGVVPITYAAYQRLLPELTDEQKRIILANLIEAREYAMDAGSSDEKHGWFGKYKGRINNYLSAAGFDLKQAERELAEREKQDREPS